MSDPITRLNAETAAAPQAGPGSLVVVIPFAGLSSHNKPPFGTPIGFLNAGLPARQSLGNGIPPDRKSVSPRSDRSETQ